MMEEIKEPLLRNAEDYDSSHLEVSINHDPPPPPDPTIPQRSTVPMSRYRVVTNLCGLFVATFMFFIGFMALSNLQSTMNSAKSIGTESQAAIYITSMLSSLLLPELCVKKLGCQRTLFYAVLLSLFYIGANLWPRLETLLPTAVLLGIAAGPLTSSQSFYVDEMALRYHGGSATESVDAVVSRFFGFNSFAQENTQIWGNLISYAVLSPRIVPIMNDTNFTECGRYYINSENGTNFNLQPPTNEQRHVLVFIFIACGLCSAGVMKFFVDPLGNDIEQDDTSKGKCSYVTSRLTAALTQLRKFQQLMLVPISVFCGIETSFYASDFTQAYIACSWGVHHVGFVTICFGVCGALMSILVGPLVKFTSQKFVIIMAAAINLATFVALFFWVPDPETPVLYFVFAGVWGMTDAIWWSQMAALYGLMFPNDREAAFSNFFFWSFLGYFLSYSYANYFNVAVKIAIMLGFLIVGIVLYAIGQWKDKCCSPRSAYVPIGESD